MAQQLFCTAVGKGHQIGHIQTGQSSQMDEQDQEAHSHAEQPGEGTQNGDVFKLKNKGIPKLHGRGSGDQYVKVHIEVPKNLTNSQRNGIYL